MRKIYFLALMILPVLGFSQDFSFDILNDTAVNTTVGADVNVDINIVNNTANDLNLRWRMTADFVGEENWEDYICEGTLICWPTTKRFNDIVVDASGESEIFHHILVKTDSGAGVSEFCVFDVNDSANTLQCSNFYVTTEAAAQNDTIEGFVDGIPVIVVNGDTFQLIGGMYVPLGLDDVASAYASGISQNAPNPAKDFTVINYQLTSSNGILKFHDLTGKLVNQVSLNNNSGQYTMNGELEAGIYFYSLWENGAMIDSKRMQVID